jgi:16S rRNA pseudouridine516 synthase
MKSIHRLDKVLGHMGYGTRKEIKKMVKNGWVTINGDAVNDSGVKVNPYEDRIVVDEEVVEYREFVYLLMNKPPGVISATEDDRLPTVVDLLDEKYKVFELFPVGRLDRDTEGLLLLTNDGKLAHELLSPKKHVPKTYYAHVEGKVTDKDKAAFVEGVVLDDGYKTMPAELHIIESEEISKIELTIHEGKFHQVKRMFESVGKTVVYLKRISMGPLRLDEEELPLGAVRELMEEELNLLQNKG